MPQHDPNLYGTTIPNHYKHANIVAAPVGKGNGAENGRNCEADGRKVTKQRKKASRACDQCRKKRIKCKFNQNTGVCQGCLEVGEYCLFVRVPLKRGPAKRRNSGNVSEKVSSDCSSPGCRSRTHSYSMNLENNHLPSLARNFSFPSINSLFVPSLPIQSQQFWKVPYGDIKRRSSFATFHNDSPLHQENSRSDHSFTGIVQRRGNVTSKGTITPVEGKDEHLTSARCQGQQFSHSQEQRSNPCLSPSIFGIPRRDSVSYTSDAAISEGNSYSEKQCMLTPNSVHSIERERLNSLTAGSLDKKLGTNDDVRKWENSLTWKPVYGITGPSRPSSEKDVSSNNSFSQKPPIFSTHGQFNDMSFLRAIDIYYNFFHVNFPIIPISKKKFTGMFVSTKQPVVHEINKINNEIIQHFKNSLEILVFSKVKQGKSSLSWPHDNLCDLQKSLYYAQNFGKCINQCFQNIMIVKCKLKQNSIMIPSRIKFIYFSTIIVLNFILVLTGDENSSLLGPSVGVFNDFQTYKLFLPLVNATSIPLLNSNEKNDNEQINYTVLFKRSYILLSILDSIQSFRLGQPKLINLNFSSPIHTYFSANIGDDQNVEQNPTILDNILQNLKLGGFITDFVLNRKSLQINSFQNSLSIDQASCEIITDENEEPDNITGRFETLLKRKELLIKELLNVGRGQLLENCDDSNAKMNGIAKIVCSMITLISGILDFVVHWNPDNSIDFTPKAFPNTSTAPNKEEGSMSPVHQNDNSSSNAKAQSVAHDNVSSISDGENKYGATNRIMGTVSVFMLPIVEECSNIIHLVGSVPTTLISLYIRTGHMATEMIMLLSTALNELVHITGLFNKLGPFERNIHVSAKHANASIMSSDRYFQSAMKDFYSGNRATKSTINVAPPEEESSKILSIFTSIGWRLMDDSELGCYRSLINN